MKLLNVFAKLSAIVAMSFAGLVNASVDTETDANDVILAGHDAVAYFTEGKPVAGSAEYTAVHNGAIYRFSSKKNRNKFTNNPEKYAPQYGGFCAYGMTFGKKFEVNGKAFEIVDGKLYVNKNLDVYKAWKEDVPKHIIEANDQWPNVVNVAPKDL